MRNRQVSLAEWTKSSYSAVNGDCVEVKMRGTGIIDVRDSKAPSGPAFSASPEAWSCFVRSIGDGVSEPR
ncbi:DUF397 domain-containing protein [Streptomyces sparsus]